MSPKDPQQILLRLMGRTSNIGSSTILGQALVYLQYGEEAFKRIYRSGRIGSSVDKYFEGSSKEWKLTPLS